VSILAIHMMLFHMCRGLKSKHGKEVCYIMISCKKSNNIDSVICRFIKHFKAKNWSSQLLPYESIWMLHCRLISRSLTWFKSNMIAWLQTKVSKRVLYLFTIQVQNILQWPSCFSATTNTHYSCIPAFISTRMHAAPEVNYSLWSFL